MFFGQKQICCLLILATCSINCKLQLNQSRYTLCGVKRATSVRETIEEEDMVVGVERYCGRPSFPRSVCDAATVTLTEWRGEPTWCIGVRPLVQLQTRQLK